MSIKENKLNILIDDIESGETMACINYLEYLNGEKEILIPSNKDMFTLDRIIRRNIKDKKDTIIKVR